MNSACLLFCPTEASIVAQRREKEGVERERGGGMGIRVYGWGFDLQVVQVSKAQNIT